MYYYVYCLKIYNLFVQALETDKKNKPLATSANKFNFYQQCTYLVFITQCQKLQKQLPILSKTAEASIISTFSMVCSVTSASYCYRFFSCALQEAGTR